MFQLGNLLALRHVAGQQESLDQLAPTAHGHAREALVPLTVWHVRLGVEPLGEQFELCRRNLAALDAVQQMVEQRGREIVAADFRHRWPPLEPLASAVSDAVEAAREAL